MESSSLYMYKAKSIFQNSSCFHLIVKWILVIPHQTWNTLGFHSTRFYLNTDKEWEIGPRKTVTLGLKSWVKGYLQGFENHRFLLTGTTYRGSDDSSMTILSSPSQADNDSDEDQDTVNNVVNKLLKNPTQHTQVFNKHRSFFFYQKKCL